MKNGYQKFFKAAQDAKRQPGARTQSTSIKKKAVASQFKTTPSESAAEEELRLRKAFKMKKKRPPFPWRSVVGLAVTLAALGFYLAAPDKVEKWADKIQISAFGPAQAAEKKTAEKKPAADKKPEDQKTAAVATGAGAGEVPISAEEVSHFEKLRQRKEELDHREKELAELEEELQKQKVELDKRIVQLEEMRNQIAQVLKDRVEVDQEKVTKLVDLYSNMKPKQAADIIGTINEDLAVEVLAKMKKKNAAEIMNLLPADKARALSEKYTGYRRARGLEPAG